MKTAPELLPGKSLTRLKLTVQGVVQGVGFRPFVHRLASELGLCGWVNNSPRGVSVEVEGYLDQIETFRRRLSQEKPPSSRIQSLESDWLAAVGYPDFQIRKSQTGGPKTTLLLPDLATCTDCLREILDPRNRRFHYPFTNCTNCGPRFSIIEGLPYDRSNTSMRDFTFCEECQAEYLDPGNRRFHAQPNACARCGPRLELWNSTGGCVAEGADALDRAAQLIRLGNIVAVKGVGGFHLLVDARNDPAVRRLRALKSREVKPLAVMFPSIARVRQVCAVSDREAQLLESTAAPIVLLTALKARPSWMAPSLAPGNPDLGVMLPSNPLYHLLMRGLDFPVVATSGNRRDEPICVDEHRVVQRLAGLADAFLVHNRRIVRHQDDSIVRVILDQEMVLRRARGYAPLPIPWPSSIDGPPPSTVLAVGGQLKNCVALALGTEVFLSQHIGDLETEEANQAFVQVVADLPRLYGATPEVIAADFHPDYRSSQFASRQRGPVVQVQHHVAHVLSCVAEQAVELPALGVAWDGTGYGLDETIWGSEFFVIHHPEITRVAHLRPFPLPGGDQAVKEPRRAAIGLLHEWLGDAAFDRREWPTIAAFSPEDLSIIKTMLNRNLNSPRCSSMGRLFDAVASLANLRQHIGFEGQAAMDLEFAGTGMACEEPYRFSVLQGPSSLILDWSPMLAALIADCEKRAAVGLISAKFHQGLVAALVDIAKRLELTRVVLSGGCFQNRQLLEGVVWGLQAEKFQPFWQHRLPAHDGGLALGQVFAVRHQMYLK